MKILTWNINGIRAGRGKIGLKDLLDSLCADVICLQETKVTRDMLDEPTAIVDGYESYFGFSRKRTGYSGTVNYCKTSARPEKAEEGLTGILSASTDNAVDCYGNMAYSDTDLEAVDAEGRCVITQHKIRMGDDVKSLAIINVYTPFCGSRDERQEYKVKFLSALQCRAEALLQNGIHVIILGDLNIAHKKIDNCKPDSDEEFKRITNRIWLNNMLRDSEKDPTLPKSDSTLAELATRGLVGGKFSDVYRRLHPTQTEAYTNWCTSTNARKANYGRRLDYILVDKELADHTESCEILVDVEGSDHCPVILTLSCDVIASDNMPALCAQLMPEFKGYQQKLFSFFKKASSGTNGELQNSQGSSPNNSSQHDEQDSPVEDEDEDSSRTSECPSVSVKRPAETTDKACSSKAKQAKLKKDDSSKQVSLTMFFSTSKPNDDSKIKSNSSGKVSEMTETCQNSEKISELTEPFQNSAPKSSNSQVWKSLLKGLVPPPVCPGHNEPCVLKTVRKAGPNKNKQFYICARPDGAQGKPEFRCKFFQWLEDRQKKKS